MEQYVVSARKYRPDRFEDLVGQRAIATALQQAIDANQLAQALLFCGPRGVGKTSCARIVARKLNESTSDAQKSDFSFNIFELDAASNNSVDDIRSLSEQVRFAPQVGKYKVYIIDEVHMLSQAAFNAFLKTLEEPPKHVVFILATTEKHRIIPTIRSRCQIYDFKRISVSDIKAQLEKIADREQVEVEGDALHLIAQKADGALRDALSLFDRLVSFTGKKLTWAAVSENLNVLDHTYFFEATDLMLQGDYRGLLLQYDEILTRGFPTESFLAGMGEHLRDLLVATDPQTHALLEVGEEARKKYIAQAQQTPVPFLFDGLAIVNAAERHFKTSQNKRLTVEIALVQLASRSGFQSAKKKATPLVASPPKSLDSTAVTQSRESGREPGKDVAAQQVDRAQKVPPSGIAPSATQSIVNAKRRSAFSITARLNEEAPAEEMAVGCDELPKTPFAESDLKKQWNDFAKRQKEEMRHSYFLSLTASNPQLEKDFVIAHTLPTQSLLDDFKKHQTALTDFLREKLDNYTLSIRTRVDEEAMEKLPYTPQEKYAYFAAKNPLVAKLLTDLELELDH